ncbi:D-alanyl-D-alanine carboxypeptidase family protein [Nitratidesulfovibrio liaohensis]|uniref:D-alanyl-D-alanine carboxypeptidase n=1 Tax=Nitratidesulfovibrio liaohensis TaxID=2604158 RepID=A0ABY9R6L3_9BACT|nr:D-alanyl-D-alanine carboxypeptidase family protein [Nitratidesulfovibrio liaohensis]WMW66777.1 D-alanyl-D-alanine carboxypeptidase [Nitratidesulfovibrio liaohensis]
MRMHSTVPGHTAQCPHHAATQPAAPATRHTAPTVTSGLSGIVLLALAVALLLTAPMAHASTHETLDVRSAMLLDMSTGRIIYEQNADEPIPPASLTKVLSMFVTLDQVRAGKASLKDTVKVSRRAFSTGGSRMFLKQGETLTLNDLLEGMAVSSGNDASVATAEYIGGNVDNFVQMMNAKARALGMKNSVFRNPHGLPAAGQHTTARDMLTLSRAYLAQYPEALRYHSTRFIKHNKVITTNKNPLLGNCEGADGLKTGWVFASGYNLISTVKRGKTRLLAVVLGAETTRARAQEVNRLVEAGFRSVAGGGKSVSTLLADMKPADYALNLHKTNSEAYAELRKTSKAAKSRKTSVAAAKTSEDAKAAPVQKKSKKKKATATAEKAAPKASKTIASKSSATSGNKAGAQSARKAVAKAEDQEPAPKAAKKKTSSTKSTADKTSAPGKKAAPREVADKQG